MTKYQFLLSGFLILGACAKAPDKPKVRQFSPDPIKQIPLFELLSDDDSRNFIELPLRGDVRDQKKFWSGDYWPLKKGNINRRWNARLRIGFNHRSPGLDELRSLPQEKIAELAPSEKFDILMGNYDYPLRKEVNSSVANENAESWEGMCNGWAVASFLHVEPQPKILTNADGIQIPFGSEDIKGLLSYYYSYHTTPKVKAQVGQSCETRNCQNDVTAATFHLALANTLGVKKAALLMDLDRSQDVWNHPVVAFESEYRGNAEIHDAVTPGTQTVIRIKTTVTYVDEELNQTWVPVLGTGNQLETVQIYQYWLHLDREGMIIGSEWKSNERPDYLWTINDAEAFEGNFSALKDLMDDPRPEVAEE